MHIIILITIILLIILYCNYICNYNETFVNKMEYCDQDLVYNSNPRDPDYKNISFTNNSLVIPNSQVYTNKSLYSIDFQ